MLMSQLFSRGRMKHSSQLPAGSGAGAWRGGGGRGKGGGGGGGGCQSGVPLLTPQAAREGLITVAAGLPTRREKSVCLEDTSTQTLILHFHELPLKPLWGHKIGLATDTLRPSERAMGAGPFDPGPRPHSPAADIWKALKPVNASQTVLPWLMLPWPDGGRNPSSPERANILWKASGGLFQKHF